MDQTPEVQETGEDGLLCEHLSPPQGDGVQAVRDQPALLELKSKRGCEAASEAGLGPQLSTQKLMSPVIRLRFQALRGYGVLNLPKLSWPICPLCFSQGRARCAQPR